MKAKRIIDALNNVDSRYIDEVAIESENKKRRKMPQRLWVGMVGAAAAIALLIFAGPGATNPLEVKAAIFSVNTSGVGTIYVENVEELRTANPWTTDMVAQKFPVYQNHAFVSSAGEPGYYTREELLVMAENVAKKLETQLVDWEYVELLEEDASERTDVSMLIANAKDAVIQIEGDGSISVEFTHGVKLPEEYVFSNKNTLEEANKVVDYLTERYASLLGMADSIADCRMSYDVDGNREITYVAFSRGEKAKSVAEYCFKEVIFYADEEGCLSRIHFGDVRQAAEYLGDYTIVTQAEAEKRLQEGNYVSIMVEEDVKGGSFSEDNIAKVEVVYLTGSVCEYFQPYYCFYIELDNSEWGYGRYYVPAVENSYLDEFAEENPIGN